MPNLTSRELMFLEDHLALVQNSVKMLNHYAAEFSDPQLKSLCQGMAGEHQQSFDRMFKHLSAGVH